MPESPASVAVAESIAELGRRAKAASRQLALTSTAERNEALLAAADLLVARSDDILAANRTDIDRAESEGVSPTVVDRLRLTPARVEAQSKSRPRPAPK